MALDRDGSSVVLLSLNGKPAENNNMLETDTFKPINAMEYELKPNPVKKRMWTRVPVIVGSICIVCAIAFTIAAVVLVIRFTGSKLEKNQTIPVTSPFPPISPTPSKSSSVSPSSYTIEPSFTQTYPASSSVTPSSSSISTSSSSEVIQTSSASPSSSTVVTSPSNTTVIPLSTTTRSTTTTTKTTSTTTITTTTTISTTHKPCSSDQFQCHDGSCIDEDYFCDGKPQCPLSEDEPKNCTILHKLQTAWILIRCQVTWHLIRIQTVCKECSDKQFTCSSGQCVASRFRCDGTPQCLDTSDEMNCTNCSGFECDSGLCLWTSSVKCNGVVDCLDLSDEMKCRYKPYHQYCKNGVQIPRDKVCDGVDDCFDNSDEEKCDGECNINGELLCGDMTTCIMHTWMCDGYQDCPDGFDESESECKYCSSEEFQCADYSCIDNDKVCDGNLDCPGGMDEHNCVKLQTDGSAGDNSGVVMVRNGDQRLPVCSDGWSAELSDLVCSLVDKGFSTDHTSFVSIETAGITNEDGFMTVDNDETSFEVDNSVLSLLSKRSECSSQMVVKVSCKERVCGTRKVDFMTPFIVGGSLPPLGKWPWAAALFIQGKYACSGAIVDNNWILTAAHCVITPDTNYTLVPQYYTAVMGSISAQEPGTMAKTRTIDQIVLHPNATRLITGIIDWDMALLHLSEPVSYSNYVQPVCLPSQGAVFSINSQCYLAGWGYINTQRVTVNKLRDTKMRLWTDEECRQNTVDQESQVNTMSTLCAGYHSGLISACQGDSGGPMMCSTDSGHWILAGIVSSGAQGCNGQHANKANRFARISASANWIDRTITLR